MNYVITGERTVQRSRKQLYDVVRARLEKQARTTGEPVTGVPSETIELDWRAPATGPDAPPGPFGERGQLHLTFASPSRRSTLVQLRMTATVSLRWWLVLKLFGKGAGMDGGLMLDDLLRGLAGSAR